MTEGNVKLDSVAMLLAAHAGVAWRRLPDYPGFSKGRWRDLARWIVSRASPQARVVEGPLRWDGTREDARICNLSRGELNRMIEAWTASHPNEALAGTEHF